MLTFLARRLGFLVFVILGVSVLTFVVSHVVPADPAALIAGKDATPEKLAQIRHTLGLDKPLPLQYVAYMANLVHGNLGLSSYSRRPVLQDFVDYFPATIELTLYALVLCVLLGVPLGVYAGVSRGGVVDHVSRIGSIGGSALPLFWLGLVLQLIFYGRLGWLPESGRLDAFMATPHHITGMYTVDSLLTLNVAALGSSLKHVILPAITLALSSLALVVRVTRASMVDVLAQDYIRTARAKGVPRRFVVMRHALRNALIPTTTLLGLQVGNLLSGAFLVEIVFSWPGIGFYSVNAIENFDYQAIMSITVLVAVVYTFVNLLVDIAYTKLDPRIRFA
jgi:peptide/nickel transport system permease protein